MKSVQEFTRGFRDDTQDADHLQAGDALALLLSGEADADDTAKSITMIYDVSLKRNNGFTHNDEYNKVRYFWMRHMCGAIYTFGDDAIQERLIDLLTEISKQPEVKCPDGSTKMHCGVQIYWRDLPGRSFELQAIGLSKSCIHESHLDLLMPVSQITTVLSITAPTAKTTFLPRPRAC
jgi:hypothetical protein